MRKPNVMMITCHDLGQHLGCYGVETVRTPNLDGLAARGVRFSRCTSTSARRRRTRRSLPTSPAACSTG